MTHYVSRLVVHSIQLSKAAFVLYQFKDGLFVSRANASVALPVAHFIAIFNVTCPLADRGTIGDLAKPVTPTQVALAPRLLATQILVQISTSSLVRIHMQKDALMADRYLALNLLGAPLNAKVEIHIGPNLGICAAGVTAALGSLRLLGSGLLCVIPTLATTTTKFSAAGATLSSNQAISHMVCLAFKGL